MVQLNFRDSKPIFEQLTDGLRRLISSGAIEAEEKLPSVREMAAKLTINPKTIRRSYDKLMEEDFLYTNEKGEVFVVKNKTVQENRANELLTEFDKVVKELMYLAVDADELRRRLEELEEGGTAEV